MVTSIANSRNEILAEVRAKRAKALRFASFGNPREQEYWLHIAGRMTRWIEHLEESGAQNIPKCPHGQGGARPAIDLPPSARRCRGPADADGGERA